MRSPCPILVLLAALATPACLNLGAAPAPSAGPSAVASPRPAASPTPASGVPESCAADFRAADGNADERVTSDEYAAFRTKGMDAGSASHPAVKVSLQADFERLDANKDGRLAQAEFCALPGVPRDAQ